MTWLVGQERYKWIEEQYGKYRRWQYMALALIAIGIGVLAVSVFIPTAWYDPFPILIRQTIGWSLIISFAGSFLGGFQLFNRAEKLLPPWVEDRVLHFLTPTLLNLKAYVSDWNENDRKKAVKDLGKISRVLDIWDTGNLKFVKDTAGKTVNEFKENFQGRVIPAIKEGDKRRASLLQIWLSQFQNTLEMGQLNETHLKGWNAYLTITQDPQDPASPPQFPYHEPKPSRLKWLKSKWFHLIFIFSLPLAPAVIYSLAISTQLASRDAAFGGAIAVLVAVIAAYTAYMTMGRRKRS